MSLMDRLTDKRRPPVQPPHECIHLTIEIPGLLELLERLMLGGDTEEVNRRLRAIVADLKRIQ